MKFCLQRFCLFLALAAAALAQASMTVAQLVDFIK